MNEAAIMFSSSAISQIIWRYFKYFIAICFLCFIIVMAWKFKSMGSETEISHEAVTLLESLEKKGNGRMNHFSANRTSKSLDFSNLSADSRPRDCSEISQRGKKLSGVYTIWPRSNITQNKPLQVYCDMNIDGEGWTVIQRRGNYPNPQRFDLAWDHYKNGFGDITKDFWLGNDNIYALSNQGPCEIRFDLEDAKRSRRFAIYKKFHIDNEASKYTLHIGGYSGNADTRKKSHSNQKEKHLCCNQ
ncbi:techylectin-5A [Caerostris darwini]|uniref:Techylectin-5A n=1 Tax=Caerostris darwini TaxID=1538125 RepID=A0AAV4X5V4_9ARAC|nr:techylectin-5A [Caerostris darwini]